MKPIYILNGPNLNRLGKREPEIYGQATLADVERYCREAAGAHPVEFRQSNSEAEIIGWIHEAIDSAAGIVINPAASRAPAVHRPGDLGRVSASHYSRHDAFRLFDDRRAVHHHLLP